MHLTQDRVQQAFDALAACDRSAARAWFSESLVVHGPTSGPLPGRYEGLGAIVHRFESLAVWTGGTFGTEIEAVYDDGPHRLIATARHWACLDGHERRARQAFVIDADRAGERIAAMWVLTSTAPGQDVDDWH